MEINQAVILDAEEILALQKTAYQSEALLIDDFNIPPLVETLEEINREFENQIFLKAVHERKIIGSVRAYEKEETCYIGRLIVDPEFQNRGIGSKLMHEIEKVFNTCDRFELFTGEKSVKNRYLYQKLGFIQFNTEKVNDNLSFVFLEKVL